MKTKRSLSTFVIGIILLLSLGLATTGTGLAGPDQPGATSETNMFRLGTEIQLSPDGNGDRFRPAIAYNYRHKEYLVVWHNTWPGGGRDIYARRVSDTGQVLSWFAVISGLGPGGDGKNRAQPAVAYNATNDEYLVVYMLEASPNVYEIWGRVIPWNAPGSKPEKRIIQWGNRSFWTPRVAWNSIRNEYMVAWSAYNTALGFPPGQPNDVAAHRVSTTGDVLSGLPINIDDVNNASQIDLTYNVAMNGYLAAWVRVYPTAGGGTGNDIYGARLNWNGATISPPGIFPVYNLEKHQNSPAVATNEQDRFMVVWEHEYAAGDNDIYGKEYFVNGNPAGSYFTISSWTENDQAPAIAANGSSKEWVTVWQRELPGGSGFAIHGFRWGSNSGVSTYLFEVANYAFWSNQAPAVAADIPGYLVVYQGDTTTTDQHIYGRLWWPEAIYLPMIRR
jgi:hypothetical protein